ncbi:MAG: bifunctional UDP-N-acetylglucosamine diphosphorylase/glucosamine-1-phosphate N-acetyltransferase GlmU [Acidobacteriia bacterium]|nr:bifunctional UDP-N-acetylglucosamine diphosphorylase/glucosamine-1-phosphate N-acetyltransferase GlmU [Terriglobia bacterium]
MAEQGFSVVILAAGKATRFKSEHSKMLHQLAGRPLGEYLLRTAFGAKAERVYMVIGHEGAEVRKAFARPGLTFIEQKEQLGTGHAVKAARVELARCPSPTVVVLVGDAPLHPAESLRKLVATHAKTRAVLTVLTTHLDNPHGYGRIVRARGGRVRAIVEEKVATPAQRKIREINSGILCFSREKLLAHLDEITDRNAQKEFLLTDLVDIFNRHRLKVMAFPVADAHEVLGINDRAELAQIEKLLRLRKAEALMREGVTIVDPEVTYLDEDVEVGRDTVLEPGVSLRGRTRVGSACWIQQYSTLQDAVLGDRVTVRTHSLIVNSQAGSDVVIGPFAHLRDGAVIEPTARIGNFVEVKKSRVGRGTKALHLTYLGDATLGERTNIGAGTVTCNYDGKTKNPTVVEDEVFIGSGNMLVAPVRIGKGSYTAAGSTITEDVPPESLAIARGKQVTKVGWASQSKAVAPPRATFTVREVGAVTVCEVGGRLTMGEPVELFRNTIHAQMDSGRALILVNLAKLMYIDSAGLGELAKAQMAAQKAGGRVKFCGVNDRVLPQIRAAKLDRVLEIFSDESAALASFEGRGVSLDSAPENAQ